MTDLLAPTLHESVVFLARFFGTPVQVERLRDSLVSARDTQQGEEALADVQGLLQQAGLLGTLLASGQIAGIGAYSQFNRRSNEQQGSGLGLAIVRHITELHGGQLHITGEPGHGTTVTVKLPS